MTVSFTKLLFLPPPKQTGSVLVLTISIMFMVASQLLMMGLLSTSTVTTEATTVSASQEAKEEASAAMTDLRLNLMRFYNSRELYASSFSSTVLQSNRNQLTFQGKQYYVMNDAFTGATPSPYRVTGEIVGTTNPYTLRVTATGNGIRYVMQQRFSMPDFAYDPWFHKRSTYRDAVGMLQNILLRGYLYSSNGNKFQAAYDEAVLSSSASSTNLQQGISCISPSGVAGCFTQHWGTETQYRLNLGGVAIPVQGILVPQEWATPYIDVGTIGFQNQVTPFNYAQTVAKEAAMIAHPLSFSRPNSYPIFMTGAGNGAGIYHVLFDTPFQFTTPLDERVFWDRTFGPNGVQS